MRRLALTFSILMTLILPLQAIAGWSSCMLEQGSGHDHQMMMDDHACCPDGQDTQGMDHLCHCHMAAHAVLPAADLSDTGFSRQVRYLTTDIPNWPSQTYQPEKPPQIS